MKIQPRENFRLLGMGHDTPALDKTRYYEARPATNQPDWQENGKVFVSFADDGCEPFILLDKFDYDIIKL